MENTPETSPDTQYSHKEAAVMIGITGSQLVGWQRLPGWPVARRVGTKGTYTMAEIKALRAWNPRGQDLGPELYW